jgi:hypothetical protein
VHDVRCVIVLSILALLGGCDPRVKSEWRTLSESVSYSDTADQERFKQALVSAGVPFDIVTEQRGQEFVRWDARYSAQVERITDSIFLPPGRSIRFDAERQYRFKAWLEKNGIPYRTMIEDGGEYVVWEEADAERVRAWPDFPSYFDDPPISSRQ